MNAAVHLVPLALAALAWWALHRANRPRGWFRLGELLFWDAVIVVLVFLVWLRWF